MRLRYKCRRCEKVYYAGDLEIKPGDMFELLKSAVVKRTTAESIGSGPVIVGVSMEMVHKCDEQSLGIADLQGAS